MGMTMFIFTLAVLVAWLLAGVSVNMFFVV